MKDESGEAATPAEQTLQDEPDETSNAFHDALVNNEIPTVKRIVDGLTAGYGHPEYTSPVKGSISFSGNGETLREAGFNFGSWANSLREYVVNPQFGEVGVINAGIRDKTADWELQNIDGLLAAEENAVIVIIGTDDRIFSTLEK